MLVGHYVEHAGHELYYYDEKTGDCPRSIKQTAVYHLHIIQEPLMATQLDTVPVGTVTIKLQTVTML